MSRQKALCNVVQMTAIATELQLSRERGVNSGSEHLAAFIELNLLRFFMCIRNNRAGVPNTRVDIPKRRADISPVLGKICPIDIRSISANTKIDIPNTMADIPNTRVDIYIYIQD